MLDLQLELGLPSAGGRDVLVALWHSRTYGGLGTCSWPPLLISSLPSGYLPVSHLFNILMESRVALLIGGAHQAE